MDQELGAWLRSQGPQVLPGEHLDHVRLPRRGGGALPVSLPTIGNDLRCCSSPVLSPKPFPPQREISRGELSWIHEAGRVQPRQMLHFLFWWNLTGKLIPPHFPLDFPPKISFLTSKMYAPYVRYQAPPPLVPPPLLFPLALFGDVLLMH